MGPPPMNAPQRGSTLRLIRRGSVAAAAMLAVGLYVTMFGKLSLPQTGTGQGDLPSQTPPPAAEPTSPLPLPQPRPANPSGTTGGSRPTFPPPPPAPATEAPREPVAAPPVSPDTPATHPPARPTAPIEERTTARSRHEIAEVMRAYEGAWARQDIEGLRRVWLIPDREAREIESMFRNSRSTDVRVRIVEVIAVSEARAMARVIESRSIARAGSESVSRWRGERVYHLAKRGGTWIIVAIAG
jgi:type IV secretory pathway VirB10-like protein